MPRLPHGMEITPETVRNARNAASNRIADVPLGFAAVKPVDLRRFDFLFLDLQDDKHNLLPEAQETRDALVQLGLAMAEPKTPDPNLRAPDDPDRDTSRDLNISAAYTYFGQFVDHDITLEATSAPGSRLTAPDLRPLQLDRIRNETTNGRTALLELDSVYGLPAERDPQDRRKMRIGDVSPLGASDKPGLRPPNKADANDLPREPRSENDSTHDRAALIGDPRNDENTIIAQLHLAFLLAHNKLLEEANAPNRFKKAKRRLRRHYQYIVLHDFLKQIADPEIVDDIIENGNRIYTPADEDEFFMPLEYSVAAFRFGHTMIRAHYDFNLNFNRRDETDANGNPLPTASLGFLFTFTALSGQLGFGPGTNTLPENWIIQWENFFDPQGGEPFSKARRIDTELVEPLNHLRIVTGQEEGDATVEPNLPARLAVRNLLRGYLLRMPTGQAVAHALQEKLQGVRDVPVLTSQQIEENAEKVNDEQAQVLKRELPGDTKFSERTPLWYYILAEAAVLGEGQHLGPVGSTIVAEVLVGLIRRSPDSILESDWEPNLPSVQPGTFTLPDLLRFAGVLT